MVLVAGAVAYSLSVLVSVLPGPLSSSTWELALDYCIVFFFK